MQKYSDCVPGPSGLQASLSSAKSKSHQRSISLGHFDEASRRECSVAFRRKGVDEVDKEDDNQEENSHLNPGTSAGTSSGPLCQMDEAEMKLLRAGPSLFMDHSQVPSVAYVKGHRRSISLRQRFEYSYDFILTELENARVVAGKTVTNAKDTVWKVCHYRHLPNWMQDNEYLHQGHRPPLPSFWECTKSIFRIHTETGNIWTHGLGAIFFLCLFIYEFVTISANKTATDRLMLIIYFGGIILCLIFSTIFHTFSCYASPQVIKLFSKLDYCGISLQIIGSMTPALYYGFYEDTNMFLLYFSFGLVLCVLSIIVSMWDKFGEPKYRSFRALVFLTFGLSNVVPGVHWYIVLDSRLMTAFGLFIFQGMLYVIGSLLYANRIPERFFPGKCDYLFQSHQIFHILVVLAALVHLNGINSMANFHMNNSHNHTISVN